MGKKKRKFSPCTKISPGSFPRKGMRCQKINSSPKKTKKAPARIMNLPIP